MKTFALAPVGRAMGEALLDGLYPVAVGKSIGSRESGFFSRWGWSNQTWSGKNVTVDVALQCDIVWSCVRLIAEAISTLPFSLYARLANGGRELASAHPLNDILHSQPSARMSAVSFWQAVVACLLLWGNAFALVERRTRDRSIISLEFILPHRVRLEWDQAGRLHYHYSQPKQPERELAPDSIIHFKAFTMDGEVGMSAIQYGRNSIGSALAQDQASDETFKNASRASGIITMGDVVFKAGQRDQVREHVRQVAASGGVYVLEKGAGFQPLRFNPHDAELLATRSFSVETICRWFRVPPVMVGHGDKQSSWPTSTEAQGALFLRYVLRSVILSIEQEVRRSLLLPGERAQYFAEFSIEGLLRGDSAARAAFYQSALSNGWMTRNEVRRMENLPPVQGGDILTVQSAMVSLDNLGKPPADPADNARAALKRWLDTYKEPGDVREPQDAT